MASEEGGDAGAPSREAEPSPAPDILFHDEGKPRSPPKTPPSDSATPAALSHEGAPPPAAAEEPPADPQPAALETSAHSVDAGNETPGSQEEAAADDGAGAPLEGIRSGIDNLDLTDDDMRGQTPAAGRGEDASQRPSPPASPGPSMSHALSLSWVYGVNNGIIGGVHTLTDETAESTGQRVLFYVSAHTGILWDIDENRQKLLQGHCNAISTTCISDDKRWIATADKGPESMVIIWDARSGTPIRTLFEPHRDGVVAMAMSPDARFLATVGATCPQTLCVWDWTADDRDRPVHCYALGDYQEDRMFTSVRFDSADARNIVATSPACVTFIQWNRAKLEAVTPVVSSRDFNHVVGAYTQSAFTPGHALAITGTVDGDIVVWQRGEPPSEGGGRAGTTRSRSSMSASSSARPRTGGPGGAHAAAAAADVEARVGPARVTTDGSGATFSVKASKIVRLHESSVNVLVCTPSRVVTGSSDGYVRLYDHQFRIVDWFERFESGPVTSLSFARSASTRAASPSLTDAGRDDFGGTRTKGGADPFGLSNAAADDDDVPVPEFVVGTANASVILVEPRTAHATMNDVDADSWKAGRVVLCGQEGELHAIAAHPSLPRFAMCGYGGSLHVWDYAERTRVAQRAFESKSLLVHCLEFAPDGKTLAVGFTNGVIKLIDASTLADLPTRSMLRTSRDAVTRLCFSEDSSLLASADADMCVTLFGRLPDDSWRSQHGDDYGDVGGELLWTCIGKHRSHTAPVTGLMFGTSSETGLARLLSLGADRTVVDYDLPASNPTDGLKVRSVDRLEQSAVPTAMLWYPPVTKEGFILVANDRLKLKLYNATTLMCRQTVLGPTFGGPPVRLSLLPCPRGQEEVPPRFLAYATTDRIIGLVQAPLEGHPHTSMAVIAHPGEVTAIACTYDGSYVITAGGKDGTVNFWRVNVDALKAASRLGGEGMQPYLGMIEGGRDGEFFRELEDYFYYAQVRNHGEDTMAPREVTSRVPVGQVPSIMRALGFFPSEQQVEDIVNEVKFSSYVDTQEYVRDVSLEELVKLYINHRPVYGISSDELEDAFAMLASNGDLAAAQAMKGCGIPRARFLELIQARGESMPELELADCLSALLGDGALEELLPEVITPETFARDILGFTPFDAR